MLKIRRFTGRAEPSDARRVTPDERRFAHGTRSARRSDRPGRGRGRSGPRPPRLPVRPHPRRHRLPAHGQPGLARPAHRLRGAGRAQSARLSPRDRPDGRRADPQDGPAPFSRASRRPRREARRPGARGRLRRTPSGCAMPCSAGEETHLLGQPLPPAARQLPRCARRPDPPGRDHPCRDARPLPGRHLRAGRRLPLLSADRPGRAPASTATSTRARSRRLFPFASSVPDDGARRPLRDRPPQPRAGHRRSVRREPGERQSRRLRQVRRRQVLLHQARWRCATSSVDVDFLVDRSRGRIPRPLRRGRAVSTFASPAPPASTSTRSTCLPLAAPTARRAPDPLAEHVTSLLGLLELMLADRGPAAERRASALSSTGRSIRPTPRRASPPIRPPIPVPSRFCATFTRTLRDEPERESRASLANRLRRYVDGSLAGLFARPTNVALDRPFVVFNVQSLEPELRPIGIHLIASFVWNQVRRQPSPAAADHRRGLEPRPVSRGRRLPGEHGAAGPQVLPGAGDDHPGRRRLPRLGAGTDRPDQRRAQALDEAGQHDDRAGRVGLSALDRRIASTCSGPARAKDSSSPAGSHVALTDRSEPAGAPPRHDRSPRARRARSSAASCHHEGRRHPSKTETDRYPSTILANQKIR